MTPETLKKHLWLLPHLKEMIPVKDVYGDYSVHKKIDNYRDLFIWQGRSGNWYIEINRSIYLNKDVEFLLKLSKTPNYEELLNFL